LSYHKLEKTIAYTFKQPLLLERALTHASKSPVHLERQEFLGDAVLGLCIANYLYLKYSELAEGDLSKMRANLVCKPALYSIAQEWALEDFLQVGDGERFKDGRLKSKSIAANAVEAVIGAVFEDSGYESANDFILKAWDNQLQDVKPINLRDAKSQLQELTQSKSLGLPTYQIHDLGVNQSPRFVAECSLGQEKLGEGKGNRKKEAELLAAQQALNSPSIQKITD